LEEFGVLCPERTPNWGWKLSNGMFQLSSLDHCHKAHTTEKMSEINQKRFASPLVGMAPLIFRLAGHTYIIHSAEENENPTEEQRQLIINRFRLYRNNNAPEEDDQEDFFSILFDEDEENVALQRDDRDHQDNRDNELDHQDNEQDHQDNRDNEDSHVTGERKNGERG